MGAIVQFILQLVLGLAGTVAAAIPGKAEKTLRKDAFKEREQLANAQGGGLTSSRRQQARAEALSGINAQTQQGLSTLARGSASGDGATGMDQSAVRDLYKARYGAEGQAMSGIRAQDIDEYKRRQENNRQALMEAYQMGQARKKNALDSNSSGGLAQGISSGQGARTQDASTVSSGAGAVSG